MHTNRPNFINETSVSQVGQIEAKLNEKEKLVESLNEELTEFQEQSSSLAKELETYKKSWAGTGETTGTTRSTLYLAIR